MHYDILGVAVTRCKADANISGIVGTAVYNNVPKGTAPPYLRVSWSDANNLPQKDSDIFTEGTLTFDFWTEAGGDKEVLDMMNYLTAEFHQVPLSLTQGSTNLLITRERYNTFLEGDGVSHHGVITFNLLIQD